MEQSQKKNINLIFLFVFFYGLATGVWADFAQIWLNEQGVVISNIGLIIAGATLFAGVVIIVLIRYLKKINELITLKFSFVAKLFFLISMFLGSYFSIKWLCILGFLLDSIINNLIVASVYPTIAYILKNDKIYSKRKLVEYSATDLGLLLASFLIGKNIGSYFINYDSMILISLLFSTCASIFVLLIKNEKIFYSSHKVDIKKIFKDKIVSVYLIYYFIGRIAYYSALGMQLLLLVNYAEFTYSTAALFLVVSCILGDIFGNVALKLTPKNDYVTILIKFSIRFLLYCLIIIIPIKSVLLIALFFSLFISRAYENKTDAVYVNRCEKEDLFTFNNIRYVIGYVGKALGVLIIGFTFELGLRYIFGICVLFLFTQIAMALYLVKMRKKEEKSKLDKNDLAKNYNETK